MAFLSAMTFVLLGLWIIALTHFAMEGALRCVTPLVAGMVGAVLAWGMSGDLVLAGGMAVLAVWVCLVLLARRAPADSGCGDLSLPSSLPSHAAFPACRQIAA
jgi:hypothetical protein